MNYQTYQYCDNNRVVATFASFTLCLHNLLTRVITELNALSKVCQLKSNLTDDFFSHLTINKIHAYESGYIVTVETLYLSSLTTLYSEPYDVTYSLTHDTQFDILIGERDGKIDSQLVHVLKKMIRQINTLVTQQDTKTSVNTTVQKRIVKPEHAPVQTVSNILNTTTNLLGDILEAQTKLEINTPKIEKTSLFEKKPASVVNDDNYSDTESNNDQEDNTDLDPEEILKQIQKLESASKMIKETVRENKDVLHDEKDNLANFMCRVNEENRAKRYEEEKAQQRKNVFTSEKEHTYPLIYTDFFVKRKFDGFGDIPPLFIAKFPVFLFMDGKDHDGNDVRPRLLDRPDEYEIYELLLNALTDDEFELPENDEYINLVKDFNQQLPQLDFVSQDDIMKGLNEADDDPLFNQSVCSGDDATDTDDEPVADGMRGNNGRKANATYGGI